MKNKNIASSRGRKKGGKQFNVGMTIEEISAATQLNPRTVQKNISSGVAKLKAIPGAFELLLECVQAVSREPREVLRAQSAECQPWVALTHGMEHTEGLRKVKAVRKETK